MGIKHCRGRSGYQMVDALAKVQIASLPIASRAAFTQIRKVLWY